MIQFDKLYFRISLEVSIRWAWQLFNGMWLHLHLPKHMGTVLCVDCFMIKCTPIPCSIVRTQRTVRNHWKSQRRMELMNCRHPFVAIHWLEHLQWHWICIIMRWLIHGARWQNTFSAVSNRPCVLLNLLSCWMMAAETECSLASLAEKLLLCRIWIDNWSSHTM